MPGEQHFYGRGVSVCASCDGWAYKGKAVVMVGGGDSALTEALHLHNIGVTVTLVHRRDAFRAQKRLQDNVEQAASSHLEQRSGGVPGRRRPPHGVRLKNVQTGETRDLAVDGAFVAIGWQPNVDLAEQLGVKLDERATSRWTATCAPTSRASTRPAT